MLCSFKTFFYSLAEEMYGGQSREFACGFLRVKGLIWQIFKCQLLSVDLHTHGTLHGSYVWRKLLLKIPSPVRGSTIGVLKSRFPAFFSSESRHPALFYA